MQIVNEQEFDEIIKNGFTLVDFFADWCGPCKMLSPILEELSEEYTNIKFIKVNVDDNMDLAGRYGIMSIPTIFIFKDGQLLVSTQGYRDKDGMKLYIEDALKKGA